MVPPPGTKPSPTHPLDYWEAWERVFCVASQQFIEITVVHTRCNETVSHFPPLGEMRDFPRFVSRGLGMKTTLFSIVFLLLIAARSGRSPLKVPLAHRVIWSESPALRLQNVHIDPNDGKAVARPI